MIYKVMKNSGMRGGREEQLCVRNSIEEAQSYVRDCCIVEKEIAPNNWLLMTDEEAKSEFLDFPPRVWIEVP